MDLTPAQKLALILPARDAPWIVSGVIWAAMTLTSLVWIANLRRISWEGSSTVAVQPQSQDPSSLPERYRNQNISAEELPRLGTIARGRATLRRQKILESMQPKEAVSINARRKSFFGSVFGSWNSKRRPSAPFAESESGVCVVNADGYESEDEVNAPLTPGAVSHVQTEADSGSFLSDHADIGFAPALPAEGAWKQSQLAPGGQKPAIPLRNSSIKW